MMSLIRIPHFRLRLQIWDFKNSFQERFDSLAKAEKDLANACTHLATSGVIRHVLGIVLFVGNHLNGGTPRGRADGFAIDTLGQMRTVKMSQGEGTGTLVDYILHQMEKSHPGELELLFAPGQVADCMKCAARHKLGDLTSELNRFRAAAKQMLAGIGSSECAADPTFKRNGKMLEYYIAEIDELARRFEKLEEQYLKLRLWFHMEDTKERKSTDEFFGIWSKFMLDLRQTRKTNQDGEREGLRRSVTPKRVTIAIGPQEVQCVPARSALSASRPRRPSGHDFSELTRAFSKAPPPEALPEWRL